MFRIARAFLIYLLMAAPLVHAGTLEEQYGRSIDDDAAREVTRLALTKITSRMCEPQRPCSPATPEEFSKLPIAISEARTAMAFGIKSALALWCGLGDARSYQMLWNWALLRQKMNSRQSLLIFLIHNDLQAKQSASIAKLDQCPEQLMKELDAQIPILIHSHATTKF